MRLLIVEDELDALEGMELYFASRGHEVYTAPGGVEALALIKATQPDLMLLDLKMKGTSGFEVMEKAREIVPSMTIVVITGLNEDNVEAECRRLGAARVLHKPIKLSDLDALLHRSSTK